MAEGQGGSLNGTSFTKTGEDFESAGVQAGGVVYLSSLDGLDGAYEIISVVSATQLTISVLRADETDSAVSPPQGSDISYRISTFAPQANTVFFQLTEYFGIQPGNPGSTTGPDDIIDISGLRRASVLATIASIYATLANRGTGKKEFWAKSLYYQKLFTEARERCRVVTGIGGSIDRINVGGSLRLKRM
ncbi:MAG: hypothetical protein ABIG61_08095 [Planctomycetota bacterium]